MRSRVHCDPNAAVDRAAKFAYRIRVNIGPKIKSLRLAAGLNQAELAASLGVSQPVICRWERGNNSPDVAQLPAIAAVLGVSLTELIEGRR